MAMARASCASGDKAPGSYPIYLRARDGKRGPTVELTVGVPGRDRPDVELNMTPGGHKVRGNVRRLESVSESLLATLTDFPNGEAECRYLAEDPDRARQLCTLALLSIGTVGECVRSGAPSCSLPSALNRSSDLSLAVAFLAEDRCVQALSTCLAGNDPSSGSGGTDIDLHVSTDGCQSPFTACASAFSTLDRSCKSHSCTGTGNQSCTSCSSCKSSKSAGSCGGRTDRLKPELQH